MIRFLNRKKAALALVYLVPFFLYEEFLLSVALFILGLLLLFQERITDRLATLHWREYLFFLYLFHMLFGERAFAYVGIEPLFVTEIFLGILLFAWRREIMQVHRNLAIYYLLVLIGVLWAVVYFYDYRLNAVRDSLMLGYAIWVPLVYHLFRSGKRRELLFDLMKLFIVLKAVSYLYEAGMIFTGNRSVIMEGFRFNVGYALPAMIVISLFLPLKHLGWRYKLLSLVMIPAVFTLFQRSIFLGILLALGFLFFYGRRSERRMILVYGFTGLLMLAGFISYYSSKIDVDLFRIIERKSSLDEGNINFRFISWQKVLDNYRDHLILGYGVGRPIMFVKDNEFYDTIDLDYFDIRDLGGNAQPHNSYLNILARFGLVLFPLFLYALWLPLARMIRIARQRRAAGENFSRYLLLAGFLLVMYVFAFFNVVLESPHHAFAFWLAVGLTLSYGRDPDHKRVRIVRGDVTAERLSDGRDRHAPEKAQLPVKSAGEKQRGAISVPPSREESGKGAGGER